ncbi:MAG: hybrid sensor histidine kinase/response regulator [Croceicoccus sp.]|uniref:histidine kinase n=1 Tax=Croceicoccus marinus TaxID=450378 RepID=A0A7G6VZE0_9SPHN|nr:PAS domain-containing sensor histidine kinase [Croceicoccus marinus]MAF29889.1 hybrid sensor histidine kinase/response regulator [Croceicoccus sp.]MAL27679.1 hybrid sensor histidine kinase/response regulator [Croceicoccus sp.]QNE07105.1 response regulator [Croceicoccus marinus]|tara:strand:+ start:5419 stop:7422 length:2004 start_codon:yes stop_codon:yes gene_type:complete
MNLTQSERAIVLAPRGRDADIAVAMLRDAGIASTVAPNVAALVRLLRAGAGFAVVTDESFHRADLRALDAFVRDQEEWSDFPFILLTERGGSIERNPAAGRYLEMLGNVTFLERPFHPTTLVSIARAALRGRLRQYEARLRLQTIRDREEQLRIALSAGRLGAWSLDVGTMKLAASEHCKANFGFGAGDDFTYEKLLSSIHPDDLDAMQAAVAHALETGTDYDIEYRTVWPDGSRHWVHVRARPELDGKGNPLRMTGVSQDITERKASEETLRNFTVELEKRVEERTLEREAVSAQLHEAQKLETLGQLTGGVAHDFNNLLTPIVGTLDLVRRRIEDERMQKLLDGALQASERARTLVARLLAFARRQNLEARATDISLLVEGMVDLIQRSIGPTIHIDFATNDTGATAMVDPNQLELALLNLAVNARDAMPDGGCLKLRTRKVTQSDGRHGLPDGDYVLVEVTDTGVGMDAATLSHAIEPFYSTKGVGKGTGLGLSMVHGLAGQSGGFLQLDSAEGYGTTATLWLPAADPEALAAPDKLEEWSQGQTGLNILLVDDEALVRQGTGAILHDLGHNVLEVDAGGDALGVLRSQPVDILVTDYLMPGMSGLELARSARKLRRDLPVLMITGFADLVDDSASDVSRLSKPFHVRELAQAIEREMNRPAGQ